MKREYALPAALSATILSFVLLGPAARNASPVSNGLAIEPPAPKPKTPAEWIALEDFSTPDRGNERGTARKDTVRGAPRLPDIVPVGPPSSPFREPPLPPIEPGENVTVIPVAWPFQGPDRGPSGAEIIPWNRLDHAPHARLQMAPEYPRDLRARQVEGEAVIEFTVDETGNVHHPVAVSATDSAFAEAAIRAVATWKFDPGTYHGRRVRFRMSVPVVFRLGAD